jgi:hypothetical protein
MRLLLFISNTGGNTMVKKIISEPLLVPKINCELDLSERGLLAAMLNNVDADYKDIKGLSAVINIPVNRLKSTIEKLIGKGYVLAFNGLFVVNKLIIQVCYKQTCASGLSALADTLLFSRSAIHRRFILKGVHTSFKIKDMLLIEPNEEE